jgi:hypothetical protein
MDRCTNRSAKDNPAMTMRMVSHSNQESLIGLRYHCTPKNFLAEAGLPRADPPCRPAEIGVRAY